MITIASWNINSIKTRTENVKRWLEQRQPDLLMLQEIKCTTDSFPYEAFAEMGYHATVHGQPSYNGVAILSREPVTLVQNTLPGEVEDILARYLEIEYRGCRFINIYAPNGNPLNGDKTGTEKFDYKLRWMQRLYDYLHSLMAQRIPFVIGGDYNIIPTDHDARNPEQWQNDALIQPQSRAAWRALLNMGLTDVYRALHPHETHAYTFWDYQAGAWPKDNGIRIDHFLASPFMADRIQSCVIDKTPRGEEKPSDHTVIIAEFDL